MKPKMAVYLLMYPRVISSHFVSAEITVVCHTQFLQKLMLDIEF